MNQKSRQKATNVAEKINLLNNSNFDYYCKDNLDNWAFEATFDKLDEMSYLKKYNIFNRFLSSFVNAEIREN